MRVERSVAVPFVIEEPMKFLEEDASLIEWIRIDDCAEHENCGLYKPEFVNSPKWKAITYYKIDVEYFNEA